MLGAGISSLDISPAEYAAVVKRYNLLGDFLDGHWEDSTAANRVYPQGSFALGTVTRRIHHDDDVDIDLVVLRGIDKISTTQSALKRDTGKGLEKFVRSPGADYPNLLESDRCWTLEYPGMHMDVLPAVPVNASGTCIWITDKNVTRWQPSDPEAYAAWFHGLVRPELEAREEILKASGVDITEVPAWRRKSNLQLAVQALKRHRDIYFTGRLDRRPTSIVVTTLAGLAYRQGGDLFDVMRTIVNSMENNVDCVNGVWKINNPAMPDENFADYWTEEPWRARDLLEWIDTARRDVNGIPSERGNYRVLERIGQVLGDRAKSAGARAIAEPFVAGRQAGDLSARRGSGMLIRGPAVAAVSRPVPNHNFHGGVWKSQ
jgi:hypothetical protein